MRPDCFRLLFQGVSPSTCRRIDLDTRRPKFVKVQWQELHWKQQFCGCFLQIGPKAGLKSFTLAAGEKAAI